MAPQGVFTYEYLKDSLWYLLGSIGASGFGSKTTAEDVTKSLDLSSTTVIITGPTSGNGLETARVLAKRGAQIILAARNITKAETVKAQLEKETPRARLHIIHLDLASLTSIHKFAADFKSRNLPLNVLINNAGVISGKFQVTEDGFEKVFATNYLGHFLLTNLLLDTMIETTKTYGVQGRIVIVTSEAVRLAYPDSIRFNHIHDEKSYEIYGAYGQSKLCNILHCGELSRRLQAEGVNVMVNSIHPGCIDTNFGKGEIPFLANKVTRDLFFWLGSIFLKTLPQGASTTCYVATNPALKDISGKYYSDCNEAAFPTKKATDKYMAAELWKYSEELLASKNVANYLEFSGSPNDKCSPIMLFKIPV